jgi:hypothetical protein
MIFAKRVGHGSGGYGGLFGTSTLNRNTRPTPSTTNPADSSTGALTRTRILPHFWPCRPRRVRFEIPLAANGSVHIRTLRGKYGPAAALLLSLVPAAANGQPGCRPADANRRAPPGPAARFAPRVSSRPAADAAPLPSLVFEPLRLDTRGLRCSLKIAAPHAGARTGAVRHERGGWRLAFLLGDSADHLAHNIGIVATMSAATMAILYSLPPAKTKWNRDRPLLSGFLESYRRPPTWDSDIPFWNVVGHPVVGMQTYLLERNWGRSQRRSFLFAAVESIVWEYGFEAWMEHPSIQDLLITAPSGWLLGEASYRATMRLRRDGFTFAEKLAVFAVNPLYVLQHGFR